MKHSRRQGERWPSDKGMERKEAEKAARAKASQIEKGSDRSSDADRCNAGAGVERGGSKRTAKKTGGRRIPFSQVELNLRAQIYVTSVHFHVFQLRLTSDFLKTRGPFDFLKSVWN